MSARLKRWKASPSIETALTPSRRKIWSNVCFTVEVPAPDEPVTEMMGCFLLMDIQLRNRPRLPKRADVSCSGRS